MSALDDIRQRAETATPGPWEMTLSADRKRALVWDDSESIVARSEDDADAEFIAHARADIPRLLGALDAVLALTDEWNTLALGDQFYARHIRAAVNDALEAGK